MKKDSKDHMVNLMPSELIVLFTITFVKAVPSHIYPPSRRLTVLKLKKSHPKVAFRGLVGRDRLELSTKGFRFV